MVYLYNFMISYNELYEILRKEKYAEVLQPLPKEFLKDLSEYLNERKSSSSGGESHFLQEDFLKDKKQLENSIALFKELMLRRKKKILNLAFVATETGIMKRDYENMLPFEKEIFDNLVKGFEEGDKVLSNLMQGKGKDEKDKMAMVIFNQDVEQFVDMTGNLVGPFSSGELASLERDVSEILVAGGKAKLVDE